MENEIPKFESSSKAKDKTKISKPIQSKKVVNNKKTNKRKDFLLKTYAVVISLLIISLFMQNNLIKIKNGKIEEARGQSLEKIRSLESEIGSLKYRLEILSKVKKEEIFQSNIKSELDLDAKVKTLERELKIVKELNKKLLAPVDFSKTKNTNQVKKNQKRNEQPLWLDAQPN